jgi:hypothetical protein
VIAVRKAVFKSMIPRGSGRIINIGQQVSTQESNRAIRGSCCCRIPRVNDASGITGNTLLVN